MFQSSRLTPVFYLFRLLPLAKVSIMSKEKNTCFIFHKWSKWEEYSQSMTSHPGILNRHREAYDFVQPMQVRNCSQCGKTQREKVEGSS